MSDAARERWNRRLIGALALGCLAIGIWQLGASGMEGAWTGSFIRSALLLGAFWLALPTKGRAAAWARVSPWGIAGMAGVMFFVLRNPKIGVPAVAITFVLLGVLSALGGRFRPRP